MLALIAEGASNKTIARRLAISVHTVKFHIASLLDKLDAEGRAEAVAQARGSERSGFRRASGFAPRQGTSREKAI